MPERGEGEDRHSRLLKSPDQLPGSRSRRGLLGATDDMLDARPAAGEHPDGHFTGFWFIGRRFIGSCLSWLSCSHAARAGLADVCRWLRTDLPTGCGDRSRRSSSRLNVSGIGAVSGCTGYGHSYMAGVGVAPDDTFLALVAAVTASLLRIKVSEARAFRAGCSRPSARSHLRRAPSCRS